MAARLRRLPQDVAEEPRERFYCEKLQGSLIAMQVRRSAAAALRRGAPPGAALPPAGHPGGRSMHGGGAGAGPVPGWGMWAIVGHAHNSGWVRGMG
jgi:hypothetical protein